MKIELKQTELDNIAEELLNSYSDNGQIKQCTFIKFYDDYDVELFYEVETEYRQVIDGDYNEIYYEVDYNRISIKDVIIKTANEDDTYDKIGIIRQLQKMIEK